MSESAIPGLKVFVGEGCCVSCHVIDETQALTYNRFHNSPFTTVDIHARMHVLV